MGGSGHPSSYTVYGREYYIIEGEKTLNIHVIDLALSPNVLEVILYYSIDYEGG